MNIFKIFSKKKSKIENLFDSVHKTYFPGGDEQITKQAEEIVKLSNNKFSLTQAKSLLLKSTMILVINKGGFYDYIKRKIGEELNEKEVKSIAGFIMFNSSNEGADKLIDSGFGADDIGYDADEIPVGYGEFGRCLTNPIPVRGITANEIYLEKLRTKEGQKIKWERLGSQESKIKGIKGVIDIYKIFTKDNKDLGKFYIFPYNRKTSNKAPKDFKIGA